MKLNTREWGSGDRIALLMHARAEHRTHAGITGTAADEARERAVEAALGRLDPAAKAALLAGADMWSLPANPGIGLARLVMSDGPAGVRGEQWTADDPSLALPSPTALAATWDNSLVREAGRVLAAEARRKGAHVVLAPTVNLHRSPRGGRHFEAYSEDPLLTGEIGTAFVSGVQDGGVGTTPKHWVANDSETDRFTVNVVADERTLRELYMAPFEAIVRQASPWGLMAAYNSVNGPTMSEHAELNISVLRDEWGFDGMLVSDWTGARSTASGWPRRCAKAGFPSRWWTSWRAGCCGWPRASGRWTGRPRRSRPNGCPRRSTARRWRGRSRPGRSRCCATTESCRSPRRTAPPPSR